MDFTSNRMLVVISQLKVVPVPLETVGIAVPLFIPAKILVGIAVHEGISVHA